MKLTEVSEFSILFYTQNRKLGNLGKSSVTSNFDSCNSEIESDKKMNWDKNQKGYDIV